MNKSVPIRVIRAAIQRHNNSVDLARNQAEAKVQKDSANEVEKDLEKANHLLAQVDEIRKGLKQSGWETSLEGIYVNHGKKLKLEASLSGEKVNQRIKAAKIKLPRKVSENDVILALASTGETDVAKALDKLGLTWRPTRTTVEEVE